MQNKQNKKKRRKMCQFYFDTFNKRYSRHREILFLYIDISGSRILIPDDEFDEYNCKQQKLRLNRIDKQ